MQSLKQRHCMMSCDASKKNKVMFLKKKTLSLKKRWRTCTNSVRLKTVQEDLLAEQQRFLEQQEENEELLRTVDTQNTQCILLREQRTSVAADGYNSG